jgi:hypothetical protein
VAKIGKIDRFSYLFGYFQVVEHTAAHTVKGTITFKKLDFAKKLKNSIFGQFLPIYPTTHLPFLNAISLQSHYKLEAMQFLKNVEISSMTSKLTICLI